MKNTINSFKKYKTAVITYHIAKNILARFRSLSGNHRTKSGTRHRRLADTQASLDYIRSVFDDYLTYASLKPDDLVGKTILEIGPGDNFGVALHFLLHGAKKVVSLDRFYSERDFKKQKEIYLAIRQTLTPEERAFFDKNIHFNHKSDIAINPDLFRYVHGYGIETADRFLEKGSFDLIVSRAVMEHVFNIEGAFEVMDRLLKPGGTLIHKIDFRDHGMFSSHRRNHPLTFLTIPDPVYKLMISHSGKPNRYLMGDYVNLLEKMDYQAKIFVTHVIGDDGTIEPHLEVSRLCHPPKSLELACAIRPKLAGRFKKLPDQDLAVSGIFLVARKPL